MYLDFWRKGLKFKGVATRKEFWLPSIVWNYIPVLILGVLIGIAMAMESNAGLYDDSLPTWVVLLLIIFGIYFLLAFIPKIALTVRRLHDAGFSGLWYLVGFVPSVGGVVLLIMCFFETKPTSKYREIKQQEDIQEDWLENNQHEYDE